MAPPSHSRGTFIRHGASLPWPCASILWPRRPPLHRCIASPSVNYAAPSVDHTAFLLWEQAWAIWMCRAKKAGAQTGHRGAEQARRVGVAPCDPPRDT
ncbi:hypothetical protein U9M48_001757, partial [Paspalum notatum var. saurae]